MSSETDTKRPAAPPYISFKTLTNLLERLQETHLPPRIDRSYLDGLSGGYQSQVIAALRWLDLIGPDGEVLPTLRDLATDPDLRAQRVGEMLRTHYPSVFALSATHATQGQLEEEFRSFGLSGTTLRKAIAFFLHAARYAEISVSSHFKIPAAKAGESRPATRRAVSRIRQNRKQDEDDGSAATADRSADLRTRYVEMLLDKAQAQDEMDSELLNRIESLLGFESGPKE